MLLTLILACNNEDKVPDITGNTDCTQAQAFPTLTADPANSDYPDPYVLAACDDDELVVKSNGIPAYEYIATTPNDLNAQDYEWRITLDPQPADQTTTIPLLGLAAFTLNGIPIYGPNEAEFPDPYGDPVYNDLLDRCLGHTGGDADYHYHALVVSCILSELDAQDGEASPIIGYAMDGFPIYGPWGCIDEECTEAIEFSSSWDQTGDPTTYAWDNYEFSEKSDETYLDECNGRYGPDGTYRYHATATFPYILGCYRGTANVDTETEDNGGQGQEVVDCADVQEGMPCCGDDICDGPETTDNCPADCQ